jgi:hypothetical protein
MSRRVTFCNNGNYSIKGLKYLENKSSVNTNKHISGEDFFKYE